jgi:hypothetical protein
MKLLMYSGASSGLDCAGPDVIKVACSEITNDLNVVFSILFFF